MGEKNRYKELTLLKIILWTYIVLCFIIAGLNYGYASKASPTTAAFITWFWHFYENWIKTFFIIICSILTLRIVGKSDRTDLRKKNLIGFIVAALVVHIIMPLLLRNNELYFFTMPLPWNTTPLHLLNSGSSFYISRSPIWGLAGITAALIFYICFSVIVLVGTLLLGRRWQCSTLCLFNGFASEVFAPAFPLLGEAKEVKPRTLEILNYVRWIFLILGLFFSFYWTLNLLGIDFAENIKIVGKIEEYIYLVGELLMAMFFWVAFIGRGYCYYCPLGTVLAFISKIAGQKIVTSNTKCIQCNKCNQACAMSIDIKSKALDGSEVTALRCVGCGHCVDACPTKTLSYTTKFIDATRKLPPFGAQKEYKADGKDLS